jgi:E3 ubiquitin-protein ligase BRE1
VVLEIFVIFFSNDLSRHAVIRYYQLLEDRAEELEKECERLKRAKEDTDGALSRSTRAEMSSLKTSMGTVKNRCEELTTESAKLLEEKRKLVESLAVVQRESLEAAKKVMHMRSSSGGGHSEFTTEQLATQVSVLKGRLACPVCNCSDKACILLRCRHMFCKSCRKHAIVFFLRMNAHQAGWRSEMIILASRNDFFAIKVV